MYDREDREIRVCGTKLNSKKRLIFGLTTIYGVGISLSKKIADALSLDRHCLIKDLPDSTIIDLTAHIENNYVIGGDLVRKIKKSIDRLKSIDCYRGLRHKKSMPVRGQRTSSNASTVRGKSRSKSSSNSVLRKKA